MREEGWRGIWVVSGSVGAWEDKVLVGTGDGVVGAELDRIGGELYMIGRGLMNEGCGGD